MIFAVRTKLFHLLLSFLLSRLFLFFLFPLFIFRFISYFHLLATVIHHLHLQNSLDFISLLTYFCLKYLGELFACTTCSSILMHHMSEKRELMASRGLWEVRRSPSELRMVVYNKVFERRCICHVEDTGNHETNRSLVMFSRNASVL